ncbi:hypothetical protein LCGC14_0538370 [marine sediment metagenome]|uniref:Uncharacterized protein n=1 Tax=marine sediment metagenome TaxID=412755 RepID=A0A0F9RYD5_9ZZZZ|nr:hypothetical protein [bacterium]
MVSCDIIDFKCIFINEIVGSVTLAIIIGMILYFIVASRLKLGFDTTIYFLFPVLVIIGLAGGGFTIIYAFATLFVAFMVGWAINKFITI